MKTTRRLSFTLALMIVGALSVVAFGLGFSDRNIAAGNLNPTDTIMVQEIRISRSTGETVTLSSVTIQNLGIAGDGEIDKIIVRDGGDILGETTNIAGLRTGVTVNLGGYNLTNTTHYLKIFVVVGTAVTGGETVDLRTKVHYVRNGLSGSSAWITDLTGETLKNGGFDDLEDSSPDAGYLNPADEDAVQIAVFTDNDANGSVVSWTLGAQTDSSVIVQVENLGTGTTTDIDDVRVTIAMNGGDYTTGWRNWNPSSPMDFEYGWFEEDTDDDGDPGPAGADLPFWTADNSTITVTTEMRIDVSGNVTDRRTIRTETTVFVTEEGEGDDGAAIEYEQSVKSETTQTIRDQGFERVEEESESLGSGTAATGDVVVQTVRLYDDDSNAFDVQIRRFYVRNMGTANGDEIEKIEVKAGATTLITLPNATYPNLDDFRTGAWFDLAIPDYFDVGDDDDQIVKIYYTIGVPDDGHTLRPVVRFTGRENITDYNCDEAVYPDSLGLYEPGFEFIENVTPPEGGVAYSGQRLLAQRIRVEDRDEDNEDVTIHPIVVKNIGNASGNPDITKIEVWRQDEEDGPEIKLGETSDLSGLRTGGARVDLTTDNIVQDAAGGAVAWLLIYLQIAEPEDMVPNRTIQLETRVLHTENRASFDKMVTSNQWTLEINHRPVPDFTFEEATNGAASIGPKADFTYEQTIQFNGTATDSDGDDIETWHWDFGDGNTSDEQNPTHQYPNGGTFDVTLTVTDERGVAGDVTKQIEVEGPPNQAPTIDEMTADPEDPAVNDDVDFEAVITDPDQPAATAFGYLWEFGDEDDSTSTVASPRFSYDTAGAYTVTLTVTDAQGATDTATIDISVGNDPPEIGGLTATPTTPNTGDNVEFQATNVTDPDDDPIDHYEWVFGDGATNDDGAQQIAHIYGAPGTYTVTVVAVDDRGGRSTARTLDITVSGPTRVVMRAYPNPAATIATINYFLPDGATDPELWIFDLNRNEILRQNLPAGGTEFEWNLRDDAGDAVSNGLYFCMISATSDAGRTIISDVFRLLIAR